MGNTTAQIPREDVIVDKIGLVGNKFYGEVVQKVLDRIEKDYPDLPVIDGHFAINPETDLLEGSSTYAVVLLNDCLPEKVHIATRAEQEKALQAELGLAGTYVDSGVVLRAPFTNIQSADFANRIAQRTGQPLQNLISKLEQTPLMVNARDLTLTKDPDYGLVLRLKDNTELIFDEKLSYKNDQKKFTKTDERGLPIFSEDGTRTFYALDGDLGGCYLDNDLDLSSNLVDFPYSDHHGRVVLVAEGDDTQKN